MTGPEDNPFAETGDDDRTVILPRRAVAASPNPGETGADGPAAGMPRIGRSVLLDAATPLLLLLARLRRVVTSPDPALLRERAVLELRRFETALREARVPVEHMQTSHYALCASLDDVVQNTPWGSRGAWADASLVSTFHREVLSGERFFEVLSKLSTNAGRFLPVLELMYLCLSLGMQGRYRVSSRGPAELDRLREEIYLVILRQRGAAERALSPHWRGVAAPFRTLRPHLPLWLAALLAAGIVGLAYAAALLDGGGSSDRVFAVALSLPPERVPAIARQAPPKPLPAAAPADDGRVGLAGFLAAEIREGLVTVAGTPAAPVVRIASASLFASGSDVLEHRSLAVLARVAAALRTRPGPVAVVGYTDDRPIHTVAFPSNYELSLARARAAAAILGRTIDPARLSSDGRADADPIASNAIEAGRALNRRIEIVLGRTS